MADKDDAEYFFEQGDAFLFPSAYLYHTDEGAIYNLCLPAFTVCEAFASEAYLKSLIKIETGDDPPSTHNLKKLFELLRPGTQKTIRKTWLKKHAWGVLNLEYGNTPNGKPYQIKEAKTFEEALDLSAQAFIKWRYNFREHHGWFMRALGYLVRREILKVRPEWKPEHGSYLSRLDPDPDFVKPKPEQPSLPAGGGTKVKYQSATFKIQVGGRSDPKNGGAS